MDWTIDPQHAAATSRPCLKGPRVDDAAMPLAGNQQENTMTPSSMQHHTRPERRIAPRGMGCVIAIAVFAGCLPACSQTDQDAHPTSSAAASPSRPAANMPETAATSTGPVDSPCALLTDAEIRGVFPEAQSGKRNTESLQYGLDRCAWETPTGQIGIEVSKVEAAAFENELRAELQGAVDPRVQGAVDRIRLQSIPDIGDHAIAVLEKADAKRGVYADIGLLAIQRGHRMAVLMIHDANRDAPLPTLDALKGLGRPLASRL